MIESFKYRIDGNYPVVTLQVSQHFWLRLLKGLLWSLSWSIIGYACVRFHGFTILSSAGLLICVLLVLAGLFVVNLSAVWSTVWLRPDTLMWREIRPFTWRVRSFPLLALRDFGFGHFSHGGPVLRMDVEGTWYVLAEEVRQWEAETLLMEIRQRGMSFPSGADQRAHAATPKFWMLQ